jgi:PAS domain S-box-containing protein
MTGHEHDDRLDADGQALRESEARLAGIIASAMDAIISTDSARRIVVFNEAAERLFGLPAAEALGSSIDRFIPERFRAAHAEHMRLFGETGTTTRSMHRPGRPLPALRTDGTEFPVEATISHAEVRGERLFTVVLRDVTARTQAEEARLRALAEAESARRAAEEANRAKKDFLAGMSHELRTPLNAIGGYVDLIEAEIYGPVTQPQAAALSRVKRNQRRLLLLINDILTYARIEAGRTHYRIEDLPVEVLLDDVEPLIEPQVASAGLHYVREVCDADLVVRGDRERIDQILLNLLTNAIKFTDAGGSIHIGCRAGADGTVEVRVRDTGTGVEAGMDERIFDPFIQSDTQRHASEREGVGLGLAISRELARGMGGDLALERGDADGATFVLRLERGGLPAP